MIQSLRMNNLATSLLLLSIVGFVVSLKFFEKKARIIFGILIVVFFIMFGASSDTSKTSTTTPKSEEKQTAQTSTLTPTPKQIDYVIYKRWDIPNGGEGKAVIIPLEYLNEADMPLVGEKLRYDTKNDRNAFIYVFTDKKAAEMRDKVLTDELSEKDRNFYDAHYVGQYTKNGNSGFHEFVIYYDGVMGSSSKTIKY